MRRRKGSGRFGAKRFGEEDINPMDGVANLSDVMLVFACGLMLALITYWNVDVSGVTGSIDVSLGEEITESVEGFGSDKNDEESSDKEYEKIPGTVYRDPVTGQMYLVVEDE